MRAECQFHYSHALFITSHVSLCIKFHQIDFTPHNVYLLCSLCPAYVCSYLQLYIRRLKPMQLALALANISVFCHTHSYMFSVIHSKIMLEFCCIIFSLRMGRFAKFSSTNMSFATNFPATKIPSICHQNSFYTIYTVMSANYLTVVGTQIFSNSKNKVAAILALQISLPIKHGIFEGYSYIFLVEI